VSVRSSVTTIVQAQKRRASPVVVSAVHAVSQRWTSAGLEKEESRTKHGATEKVDQVDEEKREVEGEATKYIDCGLTKAKTGV